MKIPGVATVLGGVTNGVAQTVRAGARLPGSAAAAVQTLASPVLELTGPVVQSVVQTTGRAIGVRGSHNESPDGMTPPVRWRSGRRVHFDLDPLLPFPRWHEHAAMVEEPVRRIPGVAEAHVEGSLGRLVVELEPDADSDIAVDEVRDVVSAVAADIFLAGSVSSPNSAPFADPGNPLAILVPLTAAAMDLVAMGATVTGWVARLPAAPQTTRALAALINHQPRMVSLMESRLGRVGTDIALAATTAAANGLTQSLGTPLLDLVQRSLQISEAAAHRRVWRDREPALASPRRPQAPVVPIISSAGAKSQEPRHSWAAAAAGEASHVVVGGSIDAAIDTAKGSRAGPVEQYVNQAANGSLIAAASALVAGGGTEDAAGAILAGVPRAAHMGRQAFAAVLGRGLANTGQLVLDPGALRRLDRVRVVVIDGAALRGDNRAVLHAQGDEPGWDVNAITGGVQRLRAEAAAAELFAEQDQLVRRVVVPAVATTRRRLEAARHATRTATVSAKSLRVGDVIDLAAPEVVPADARLLVAEDLEVDESFLTGESLPVDKQVDPVAVNDPDRASMLFEGSTIVAGHARAIVVATGVGTAAHRAISAVADVETAAGVQARLRELTSKVLPMTLAGGAAVTALALLRRASLRQAVADGVAIAVAAVPEGLPLVATLSQLAAAQRLTARGALVRSPRTIEALGRVDTICFDKTGTLTENRLRVVCALPSSTAAERDPLPQTTDAPSAEVLRAAARASTQPHNGEGHAHATDEAILAAASALAGSLSSQGDSEWVVLAEVPFESSRGYAAAIGRVGTDGIPMLMLKGAPETILPRCRLADPGVDHEHAESVVRHLAEQGLRVLAVAQRTWDNGTTHDDETDADAVDAVAHDLELIGYVGLADTARSSSRPLIEALLDAERNVVLITGDHPITARAIARQLGLPADARVVTGAELAVLDEEAHAKLAADMQVFARVSPEQKVQIVAALQRCGRVTAMVGDGANDAAAIRMADVGIGVSGRGSSAARGAADIVLTDDDLGVLLDALVEGRSMWAGVRDAVTILVGGNVGEVLFTVIGTAFGAGRAPVGTRQLLLVNLLTDMFPALAVAVTSQFAEPDDAEYPTDDAAERAQREHRRAVLIGPTPSLDAPLLRQIVNRGVVTAAGATAAWAIGRWTPGTERRTATMGLTALVMTQLAQTLLTRRHSPLVIATALGSAGVLVGIIQTPVISHFFGCTPLGPVAWTGVFSATAGATAVSALAPKWLASTVGVVQPDERPDDAEDSDAGG